MTTAIVLEGTYENAGHMIAAIKAYRARIAAEEAAEEAAANDAIKRDPEVKKWVYAAVLENSAQN